MLAAGIDGIENDLPLPEPVEENLYHFTDEDLKRRNIPTLPATLGEAVDEMEKDEVVRDALGDHVSERLIEAQRTSGASSAGTSPPGSATATSRSTSQLSAVSSQQSGERAGRDLARPFLSRSTRFFEAVRERSSS